MAANREIQHIEEDRNIITQLYLKGYSFRKIAELCESETGRSISHVTVRSDVKAILENFREERNELIEYNLTIELERINILELEYWQGWEKSKSDRKKKSVKSKVKELTNFPKADKKNAPNRVVTPLEETIEYNDTEMVNMGDPRYLSGVQWCIEIRCKLLGIEAPKKVDVTSGGKSIINNVKIEIIEGDNVNNGNA